MTLASTIPNQPDLAPNYKGGHDFINNDDDDDLMDDNGHGTHIAGIIAATRYLLPRTRSTMPAASNKLRVHMTLLLFLRAMPPSLTNGTTSIIRR